MLAESARPCEGIVTVSAQCTREHWSSFKPHNCCPFAWLITRKSARFLAGLACLEMYKVIQGSHVDDCLNAFVNLAVNVYSMANPTPPKRNVSKVLC